MSAASQPVTSRRHRWRNRWLMAHRWLGLTAGAVLVVVGLTGSLYVFHREIAQALEPELRTVLPRPGGPAAYRPWSEIIDSAEGAKPPGTRLGGISAPLKDHVAVELNYRVPGGKAGPGTVHRLFVDPYTARFLGQSRLDSHWLWRGCDFLFALHYGLNLGAAGGLIVAMAALIGLVSAVCGAVLWWPGWARLRSALAVRWQAAPVRRHFDVHRAVGFWTLVPLTALLVSGLWMNLHEVFVGTVKMLSPGTRSDLEVPPITSPSAVPPPPTQALAALRTAYPDGRLNWLSCAESPTEPVVVSFVGTSEQGLSRWAERIVWADPGTARPLHVQDRQHRRTAGDTFLAWQWPLHSGEAFGWAGRLLVCAAGLPPLVLSVTGYTVWQARRRARQSRSTAT